MLWPGIASIIVFSILAILTWRQYGSCLTSLSNAVRVGPPTFASREDLPTARIILCLKGMDPFLERCLERLVHQDYPDFRVLIVVDSEHDEALPDVRRLEATYGREKVEVVIRDQDFSTCSRKASSLYSAILRLPDEVEVAATCDGDVVTHSTWLRELVAPLSSGSPASTGNRWYAPPRLGLANLTRYFWNALAVPAMTEYRIPWGGSIAMRSDVFRDPAYLDLLKQAFSEDTTLAKYLAIRSQRIHPVSGLIMINEEETTLHSFSGFLERQLLAARLHHSAWPLLVAHAALIGLVNWILLPLCLITGTSAVWGWIAGLLIFGGVVQFLVGRFEYLVRQLSKKQRNHPLPPYGMLRMLLCPIVGTFTSFYYPVIVLKVCLLRKHVWRGISYSVHSEGVTVTT